MRLKKIKLAGFKSFVDPTTIPFPDDMTAIVGPNGCGKSNVIDAVRWVLGESSAKNLRGDAMTDVIFNGSTARKPVSQCSVELVFDNSSGRIQGEFANYNELSVKRLVTRDGQSNYFLNNTKCRRRDVTDLFLGTGLGPRSYAIIEQGMISRLIESKPQELRIFIEEAAGISKYKERRRETENRIRHTRENLERLQDVRTELGQQLEKLQRQAAAAKRYKELKSKERTLKAELSALRWLKHSEQVEQLQLKIQRQEAEIEAFISQQRGDERDVTRRQEQQQDLKQRLADEQKTYFQLGADISRLEQSQIHSKQRRQQIEQELLTLRSSMAAVEEQILQDQSTLDELNATLMDLAPLQEQLEEQRLQAEDILLETQESRERSQSQWRQQEQGYQQTKQQLQACHSEIQSTLNMQLRTEQRLSELGVEINEAKSSQTNASLDEIDAQLEHLAETLLIAETNVVDTNKLAIGSELRVTDSLEKNQTLGIELQQLQGRLSGLKAMQESDADVAQLEQAFAANEMNYCPLWQYLDVTDGWEIAIELVCEHWQNAQLLAPEQTFQTFQKITGLKGLSPDAMTSTKRANSLAEKCKNSLVPFWLNQIMIVSDEQQAQRQCAELKDDESLITADGKWFGRTWWVNGPHLKAKGAISRAADMQRCEHLISETQDTLALSLNELERRKDEAKAVKETLERAKLHVQELMSQQRQYQGERQFLLQQQKVSHERLSRLLQEQEKYQSQVANEQEQLDLLNEKVELLESQVMELEEQSFASQQQREDFEQRLTTQRTKVEEYTRTLHEYALKRQGVDARLLGLNESISRATQQQSHMLVRKDVLEQEFQELSLPMEEQGVRLCDLLQQRMETELRQTAISDQLAEVEETLTQLQKGQRGIQEKIAQMRGLLESDKLEYEGYRVRATSIMENLQEMQVSLKSVLDTLPENANEKAWQSDLETTTTAVARLGAVNLAAVEEFDIQSERKRHLDEQNDDLEGALDTLESAIRKIDRETRARFKETFDQVNDDLKMLFPKVFGGGSAYLDLTDDDLLETGVTIMARPPGKKNSTIHLLSGGEKALTALSLVFAIFRLNPAPFCLLDEVDAPLDDANVGRFCKLVSEMSKSVQFIYITHNKIAMEMATHLTGVTMAEPGVSRMVAVDVEEAIAIAQA